LFFYIEGAAYFLIMMIMMVGTGVGEIIIAVAKISNLI